METPAFANRTDPYEGAQPSYRYTEDYESDNDSLLFPPIGWIGELLFNFSVGAKCLTLFNPAQHPDNEHPNT